MFFRDKNGHKVFTTKSDVWSASITMIHVLVGKQRKKKILDEVRITKYFHVDWWKFYKYLLYREHTIQSSFGYFVVLVPLPIVYCTMYTF